MADRDYDFGHHRDTKRRNGMDLTHSDDTDE